MMIQEWVYLFLAVYGLLSFILTFCYISLWVSEKRLNSKHDWMGRLQRGETLTRKNMFQMVDLKDITEKELIPCKDCSGISVIICTFKDSNIQFGLCAECAAS